MRDPDEFSPHAALAISDLDEAESRLKRKKIRIDEAMTICSRLARIRVAVQYALGKRDGNFSTHPKDSHLL